MEAVVEALSALSNQNTIALVGQIVSIIAFIVGAIWAVYKAKHPEIADKLQQKLDNANSVADTVMKWAESFVHWAREFMDCSGPEKMDKVIDLLKEMCEKYGIDIDDTALRAFAQDAYDKMKEGEASAGMVDGELANQGGLTKDELEELLDLMEVKQLLAQKPAEQKPETEQESEVEPDSPETPAEPAPETPAEREQPAEGQA